MDGRTHERPVQVIGRLPTERAVDPLSEYFIRLATLIGTDFVEKLPLFGYLAKRVGVRQWRDTWNDDAAVVSAEAVLEGEIVLLDKGGFRISIGNPSGGETVMPLEIASDRNSLLTALADRAEEMAGVTDPPPRDGLQIFARADGAPSATRIQLHGLDLRIRLPRDWAQKGKVVGDSIQPDGDQPVDIAFMGGTVVIDPDAKPPIQYIQNDDQGVSVDPIYIDRLGIGIEIDKLKLDLYDDSGIPEVLARPGYQESWTGLYLEKFRIYGMHSLFPTLPKKVDPDAPADLIIELSKWVIGFDDGGVTGSLKVQMHAPDDGRVIRGAGFEIEFERGNMIRCEHQLTLRVGKTGGDEFSVGPEGDLQMVATARFNPDSRVGFEIALRTPGTADRGLVSLGPDAAVVLEGAIAAWLLIDDIKDAKYTDALLLSGLLAVLAFLQGIHWLTFKRVTLDALRVRYREELVAGKILKWLDFIADIELRVALDMSIPKTEKVLPKIKTDDDHPLGILMKGMRISYAFNFEDFTPEQLGDRHKLSFGWPQDYFFDLSDQTMIQGSPIVIAKAGFGRWDRGVWFELGLKYAVNQPSAAYSLMPSVVRIYFLATGAFDHFTFAGLSSSVMILGVLFIRGRLHRGDTITEASLQCYFVSSPGLSLKAYENRDNWYWDVGAQYRKATLTDGTESSIVYAWLKTRTGIPIPFLPSTALYGGHFLYAKNSRPALGGDTIDKWFTDHEPKNQIDIEKWEGNRDSTGVGFGLVLGAQADRGRPWNLQVGLLYADSQWLLSGYLNLFKKAPDPAETSSGSLRFLGAWGAGRLLGSVRWVEQLPADGKVMKLDLGAEILIDDENDRSHFYAGFHWPPEKHLKAILFERYEYSFDLLQDPADVENVAGLGVTLTAFVSALGARFSLEGGRKKGHLKLYFYFHAAADVAFAGSDPFLTVVHAAIAGGLVAKAYGIGFEFEVAAEFLWVRPQPHLLKGEVKITLDLPWPIPNLHYTLPIGDGSDGPTQQLDQLVEGLTLLPRVPSGAVELQGGADQEPVALDPTFTIAFSYPTRNGTAVDGNFQITALGLNAVDTQVTHETSGGYGYAVELTALRLWRGAVGSGTLHPGPIPAKWVNQQTQAAGGQPSRRVLELFSVEDVALARLVGPSAELVSGLSDGWTPCAPDGPPKAVCYLWTNEPLGPIADIALVELASTAPLEIRILPEPDGAESSRRYFGWSAQPPEVVPLTLLSGITRALRLSAVEGTPLPDTPAAASMELRFFTGHSVFLEMVRPTRGRRVTVRFYLGERLVREDSEGIHVPGLEGKWEHCFYLCDGPVDRAVIESSLQGDPAQEDVAVYLVRTCVVFESTFRHYQDAADSASLWNDFWATINAIDPLVLQPGTHYALQIEGKWSRLKDGNETPGGSFTKTFEFDTVGVDQWPQRLRGIDVSVDGKAGYDIKTVPAAGAVAVYAGRPMRLEFRNRRVEAVYRAFGRKLAIRLVDDQGGLDVRWLRYTP